MRTEEFAPTLCCQVTNSDGAYTVVPAAGAETVTIGTTMEKVRLPTAVGEPLEVTRTLA